MWVGIVQIFVFRIAHTRTHVRAHTVIGTVRGYHKKEGLESAAAAVAAATKTIQYAPWQYSRLCAASA